MKEINKKNIFLIVSGILFLICFLTFVFTPLSGDLRAFTANARQADLIGRNWVYNAYHAWELKSVFSRLYIYILYKITSGFTGFGNDQFETGIKFTYALCTILILMFSVYLGGPDKSGKEKAMYVLSACILVFSAHTAIHMQVEMSCTVFLFLAFGLYLNAVKTERYAEAKLLCAGLLIGSTFFFKSVLILMSVSFVAGAYLWDSRHGVCPSWKRFWLLVAGSVVMLLIGGVSILLINPEEIQDILAASVFQDTLLSAENISVKEIGAYGIYQFLLSCLKTPGLLAGLIAGIINFMEDLRHKETDRVFMRTVLWLIPLVFLVLSNKYFIYHFFMFLFPGMTELLLLKESMKEKDITKGLSGKACVVFATVFLAVMLLQRLFLFGDSVRGAGMLTVCILTAAAAVCGLFGFKKGIQGCLIAMIFTAGLIYMNYISFISVNFRDYIRLNRSAYEKNDETVHQVRTEEMLYLDDGVGAYLFGVKSYLKYYYPIPLQRLTEESEHSSLKCYTESKENVLKYDGQYVSVYDQWFFGDGKNADIKRKLDTEYVKTAEYAVYMPDDGIFTRNDDSMIRYYELYERKEGE